MSTHVHTHPACTQRSDTDHHEDTSFYQMIICFRSLFQIKIIIQCSFINFSIECGLFLHFLFLIPTYGSQSTQ